MNTKLNIPTPEGFKIIRIVEQKGYPFTWLNVYFRYYDKTYVAGYKDTRTNLHDFEDTDTAISVYNETDNEWKHFISNAYIGSVGEQNFNGKTIDDATLCHYFNSCFRAVIELTATQPLMEWRKSLPLPWPLA